jgi:hypothetical protein
MTGKAGVWCIGKAGENRVMGATGIVDARNGLGRWGGAAVLGAKNLKAVVSLGTKGVRAANPVRFMALARSKREEIMGHPGWRAGFPHGKTHKAKSGLFDAPSEEFPPELFEMTRSYLTSCMSCVDGCKNAHEDSLSGRGERQSEGGRVSNNHS